MRPADPCIITVRIDTSRDSEYRLRFIKFIQGDQDAAGKRGGCSGGVTQRRGIIGTDVSSYSFPGSNSLSVLRIPAKDLPVP